MVAILNADGGMDEEEDVGSSSNGRNICGGQNAGAKTLEDVLKGKGVITEEDYKAVTKVKPLDYKLGKGYTLSAPDQKFQLTLGGRLQPRQQRKGLSV